MPYKSLAGLKKLGSLDAEIVALAPHEPGGVCAAFSSDPVRIAAFPFSGGAPRVQHVSLDGCVAGALVDDRVAVVKSGDELWALVDLQHKPRIDSVARSIRGLVHNPAGRSALVLGWGSEAQELALEGNEVKGREFVLRGDIRCASLDGLNCYVVASDGASGGRFREHAGGTPEAGTQLRCDLPLAAKTMDRVTGGPRLAALMRRGGAEICIVRKVGAGILEPKLLALEAPAVDVAVLETSLFVATEDGRVLLFDSDALHRASDGGQVAASFALELGEEPTVLVTTLRGGNRVWIGTRSGAVLRCDAVRGTSLL